MNARRRLIATVAAAAGICASPTLPACALAENSTSNRDALNEEGRTLWRAGDFDAAESVFNNALKGYPGDARFLTNLGYLERERGRLDRSIIWFRRSADTGEDWYNYVRLAVVYTDIGDRPGMYWATRRLDETAPTERAGEGFRLLLSEDWDAAQAFAEARLAEGGDPDYWREIAAYAATMRGDVGGALKHFEAHYPELFEDSPTLKSRRPTAPLWIAWLEQQRGENTRAETLVRLTLDAVPSKPASEHDSVYNNTFRMAAYALLGEDDKAIAELRNGVKAGLRMRLFDNVVLFESLPMLASLRQREDFWQCMSIIYADNARMRTVLAAAPESRFN